MIACHVHGRARRRAANPPIYLLVAGRGRSAVASRSRSGSARCSCRAWVPMTATVARWTTRPWRTANNESMCALPVFGRGAELTSAQGGTCSCKAPQAHPMKTQRLRQSWAARTLQDRTATLFLHAGNSFSTADGIAP